MDYPNKKELILNQQENWDTRLYSWNKWNPFSCKSQANRIVPTLDKFIDREFREIEVGGVQIKCSEVDRELGFYAWLKKHGGIVCESKQYSFWTF